MLNKIMSNGFHFLWGLPILITKINPQDYEKKQILDTIEENYNKSNIRNEWSPSYFKTNIHHSLCDENNPEYPKPNYQSLQKIYKNCILEYFSNFNLKKNLNFNFEIVNYTCSKHESVMEPHLHLGCEFSMIHYLQFEKNKNSSTVFMCPYDFNYFWDNKKKIKNKIDKFNIDQSWVFSEWKYQIEEDDCIIFPAPLKHFVRNEKTKISRITIASNISIL